MPRYQKLQERCEEIAARLVAHGKTQPTTSNPDENLYPPWEERRAGLERELEQSVKERDEVLRGLNLEIHAIRNSIIARNEALISPVSAWLFKIVSTIENAQVGAMGGGIIHPNTRQGWVWQLVGSGQAYEVVSELKRMRADLGKIPQSSLSEVVDAVTDAIDFVEEIPGFDGPLCRVDTLLTRAFKPEPADQPT